MKRVMSAVAALAGLLLFASVIGGGFYLRSQRSSVVVGQADVSPSPSELPSISPTPTDEPSPTPTEVASPTTPSPSRPAAPQPAPPPLVCPGMVITSFTAKPGPHSVVLAWTISGGCGTETGWIQGSFAGTMYPGLWVVPIHDSWKTYIDHPQRPSASVQNQQCDFSLSYWLGTNGTAPDGRGVPAANAEVANVNLC